MAGLTSLIEANPATKAKIGRRVIALALLTLAVTGCAGTASAKLPRWRTFVHVKGPVDVVGPRADGSLVVAVSRGLATLGLDGVVKPFAPAYRGQGGEPYIAEAPPGCFGAGTVYALKLFNRQGVLAIAPHRKVRMIATLRAPGSANGIAFDTTGRFDHRLLVTVSGSGHTTVYAVGCHGGVHTITRAAPTVEGGIAVAPATFGRFAGDLIAPDELSGKIWAITPTGQARLVAGSRLPAGQDVGVESLGFVPSGNRPYEAFMADRFTSGNPHPGDDAVLALSSGPLTAAGVRGGDLLAATEGGALLDAISCAPGGCRVREVATGPTIAHGEGHIAIVPR
jgi:hypothetical protein